MYDGKVNHNNNGMWDAMLPKDMPQNLFTVGLMSIFTGSIFHTMYPGYLKHTFEFYNWSIDVPERLLFSALLYGAGAFSIGLYFIDIVDGKKELFRSLKLYIETEKKEKKYPVIISKKKKNYGYIMRVKPPIGITSEDFIKNKLAIEEYLDHRIDISYRNKSIWIKVYEKDLRSKYDFEIIETKHPLEIILGKTFGDIPVKINIGDLPHMIIAGSTGGGKSFFVRVIITYLLLNSEKFNNMVHLHLADLKSGSELGEFLKYENVKSFSMEVPELEKTLKSLYYESEKRQKLFRKSGNLKNITEYNEKFPDKKLSYQVLVIDELADIIGEGECQKFMDKLAQKARSSGIHVIASCQRPDSQVINGRTKNNLPAVLGLFCDNRHSSDVVIGSNVLTRLQKKSGHAIFKDGVDEVELRGFFLENSKRILMNIKKKGNTKNTNATFEVKNKEITGEIDNFDNIDF